MTTDARPAGGTPRDLVTCWTLVAGGAAAWGLTAAVRTLPWQSVVAMLLAAGLLAASLALSAEAMASDRIDLMRAARVGLLTGLVVVVAVGLAVSTGVAGVAVLGLLLLLRPGLRTSVREARERRVRRRAEQRSATGVGADGPQRGPGERDDAWDRTILGSLATDPSPAPSRARPPADAPVDTAPDWSPTLAVPTHLSDQDLCLAWESSSRALQHSTSAAERLEVVRVRQACLDELERRRPEAVRAWVLAGADPDSSPARYLAT